MPRVPDPPERESAENLIRSAFLASNRGDVEAFLRCLHTDVAWQSAGLFLYPAKIWHGHDELRQGFARRVERFGRHPRVTLTDIRYHQPLALVSGTLELPDSRLPETWIVTMRDGLMFRVDAFTSQSGGRHEWRRRTGEPD